MTMRSVVMARQQHLDRAGIVVSAACAVHCAAMPFVAASLPVVGLGRLSDPRLEWGVFALTVLVGVVGHWQAYRRHHHHAVPALLFACGVLAIATVRAWGLDGVAEPVALALGGLMAASAHGLNIRYCRCCGACAAHPAAPERSSATAPRA